jgi:hypothetical protein
MMDEKLLMINGNGNKCLKFADDEDRGANTTRVRGTILEFPNSTINGVACSELMNRHDPNQVSAMNNTTSSWHHS